MDLVVLTEGMRQLQVDDVLVVMRLGVAELRELGDGHGPPHIDLLLGPLHEGSPDHRIGGFVNKNMR